MDLIFRISKHPGAFFFFFFFFLSLVFYLSVYYF